MINENKKSIKKFVVNIVFSRVIAMCVANKITEKSNTLNYQ